MSARDDYPHVVALASTPREFEHVKRELNDALDEIDTLAAQLAAVVSALETYDTDKRLPRRSEMAARQCVSAIAKAVGQ